MKPFMAVVSLGCLLFAAGASAQVGEGPSEGTRELARYLVQVRAGVVVLPSPASRPAASHEFRVVEPSLLDEQAKGPPPKRSRWRKILGGLVGATGGYVAGGFMGSWIEGDGCHCDDPGLTGALIGAPIGAVVGGVLGTYHLF